MNDDGNIGVGPRTGDGRGDRQAARDRQAAHDGQADRLAAQGWWRAADGYWYPPEAQSERLWHGEVRGPHGEQPPGPGWWLANDYQWYPPDARPGEEWDHPVAGVPGLLARPARQWDHRSANRNDGALMAAAGLVMIILGIVLLSAMKQFSPDAGDWVRLAAWLPVGIGSSVTLLGALRYLGPAT